VSVWYPSDESAAAVVLGGGVFEGVAAVPDAPRERRAALHAAIVDQISGFLAHPE
jgi:hypothetical protein